MGQIQKMLLSMPRHQKYFAPLITYRLMLTLYGVSNSIGSGRVRLVNTDELRGMNMMCICVYVLMCTYILILGR